MEPKYKAGDELFVVMETLGDDDEVEGWDVYHATVVDSVEDFDGTSYWIRTDAVDGFDAVVPENRLFASVSKARRLAMMQW